VRDATLAVGAARPGDLLSERRAWRAARAADEN